MAWPRRTLWVVYLFLLLVLATANAAGYRYGVSDQAFYIPSILDGVEPALYPRDAALLRAQDRLMVSDEVLAGAVRMGVALPLLMVCGYVASLLVLFGAAVALGRKYFASDWTTAAFCAALTLRHRITKTGANSFEGYFHPRVAAFAFGAAAVASVARDRLAPAWVLTGMSCVLHPTTGAWWALWLIAVSWVLRPSWRRAILVAGSCLVPIAAWMLLRGPLAGRLVIMDEPWTRAMASKDYVFPDEWSAGSWLVNLMTAGLVVGVWRLRVAHGLARQWERGVVAGVCTLVTAFLASIPFIDARVALAVQLQTSRIFWLVDFLAVASVAWLVAEAGRRAPATRSWRPAVLCAVVLSVSAARGAFILTVERPGRPLVQTSIARDAWHDVGAWAARSTPTDAHLLVDPDHGWKFGHSLRIVARRDVLVEGVKDAAIAMYSRDIALRVHERVAAIGDFSTMTPERARSLARRYDLDYLVIDRPLSLPEAYRNDRFYVYRLQ